MKKYLISDFLTSLRNANSAYLNFVKVPYSKINAGIVFILFKEGYIQKYHIEKYTIVIQLKYSGKQGMFLKLECISCRGKRIYCGYDNIRKKLPNFLHGFFIISTALGILHERQLHEYKVGGEVLCYIE